MWKDKFTEVIVQRGYFYYVDKKVQLEKVVDDYIKASVEGSLVYTVEIFRYDHYIIHMECDCPYAKQSHNCKHMAAVLFEYEDQYPNQAYDLGKLMESSTAQDVHQFLSLLLVNNESLLEEFHRFLNYTLTDTTIIYLKGLVSKMKARYLIQKAESAPLALRYYLDEVHDLIDTVVAEMLLHHYTAEAFEMICYIYLELFDLEDYYDYKEEFVEKLVPVWMLIYAQASRQLKQEMYFWFATNQQNAFSKRVNMIFKQMKDITYNAL